jgi:hypothetical protein
MKTFLLNRIQKYFEQYPKLLRILRWVYFHTFRKYFDWKRKRAFRKHAFTVLHHTQKALDELGLPFWLEAGTLLGAVRTGEPIAHDLDLDIGMWLSDYSDKICQAMERHGLKKIREIVVDAGKSGREETYMFRGVTIDIFFFTSHRKGWACMHSFWPEEHLSYDYTIEKRGGLYVMEECMPIERIGSIRFMGRIFPAPEPIHEHVKVIYGDSYMIPDPHWTPQIPNPYRRMLPDKIGIRKIYNG